MRPTTPQASALAALLLAACSSSGSSTEPDSGLTAGTTPDTSSAADTAVTQQDTTPQSSAQADVTGVRVLSRDDDQVTLSVTVRSDETGCDEYADWWEVVDAESGTLLYRRILAHSHVDEQPFERSGGPVTLAAEDVVVVRAHMNTTGYSGQALRGAIGTGFSPATDLDPGFAADVEQAEPQPTGCAF